MDEGYEREGDVAMPDLTMPPSESFKRQCWVSVEPVRLAARHVIDDFGSDEIVFSTEYPHGDSKYPERLRAFSSCRSRMPTGGISCGTTVRACTP